MTKNPGTELRDLEMALIFMQDSKRHRPDTESHHQDRTTPKDRKVTVEKPELVKIRREIKEQGRIQLRVSFALQIELGR